MNDPAQNLRAVIDAALERAEAMRENENHIHSDVSNNINAIIAHLRDAKSKLNSGKE